MADRIAEMFAFVALDGEGGEGVIGLRLPDGGWLPLVGADMKRVKELRGYAQEIARSSGKTVKILRFSTREELETLK